MEADQWNGSFAIRPQYAHDGIKGDHRHSHIRWMRRNTRLRCSQDGQVAVITLARRTTTARLTLVARLRDILEVDTTCTLQQIPTGCGQVAQLARGTRKQRLREHGVA